MKASVRKTAAKAPKAPRMTWVHWVLYGLPGDTWWRLGIWLVIGFVIYFGWGIRNSKLARAGR